MLPTNLLRPWKRSAVTIPASLCMASPCSSAGHARLNPYPKASALDQRETSPATCRENAVPSRPHSPKRRGLPMMLRESRAGPADVHVPMASAGLPPRHENPKADDHDPAPTSLPERHRGRLGRSPGRWRTRTRSRGGRRPEALGRSSGHHPHHHHEPRERNRTTGDAGTHGPSWRRGARPWTRSNVAPTSSSWTRKT